MNIQQAKTEITNTLRAYTRTDAAGNGLFPVQRQRPILLMGPPGIGKTAILEQIARETGVGLVAYAMTHHTRQSAIGLPRLCTRVYDGREYTVTEYTMSEIVAAIHDCMEQSGRRQGILFLDEINCVSETLAPTMLQLLQNKTFGSHRLPEGWIIVAAGNPPAYNKSVREFDMATLDRVRVLNVEADLSVWMAYAADHRVHSAILSWLTIRPDHFYRVEDTADGKFFVTARGWEDLSELLHHYEALDIPVDRDLMRQYLQLDEIAAAFSAYYGLYRKYRREYAIAQLADGRCTPGEYDAQLDMARRGGFEERLTVTRLLLDMLSGGFARYAEDLAVVTALHQVLDQLKQLGGTLPELARTRRRAMEVKLAQELLSTEEQTREKAVLKELDSWCEAARVARREDLDFYRQCFTPSAQALEQQAKAQSRRLENCFRFAEAAFGDGQELLLLTSELSHSQQAMRFIAAFGSEAFLRHADALLYRQQERTLQAQCRELTEK